MDPKQLINHNTKKAITAMNILSTFGVNRSGFNRLLATRIYQQFIRPMMEYGLAITTTTQQSLNKLESTQSTCLRRIYGAHNRSSTRIMRHLTNTPSMIERLHSQQLKHCFLSTLQTMWLIAPTDIEDTNKRPDYVVNICEHYRYAYTTCYGEIKNGAATNMNQILDFYRLCLFTKGGTEGHNLDKVLCFQTVGVKFYVMICPCSTIKTIIELDTITTPGIQKD
ncbi:hypothetical protein BCR42DRAFT_444731 [Absidia repens]|uniref:Uncharacterized protein n=1 Tax=Absidia repens TaxID=90262 RepID=A0A1X2HE30_9FUNG|nr:hypothetical protein BCR42DRAFT_444731 [Absidia repens]